MPVTSHAAAADLRSTYPITQGISRAGLGAVIAAHVALAAVLVSLDVLPAPSLPQTLRVSLLPMAAEAPAPVPAAAASPRPPVPRPQPAKAPVLAAAADASHSASVPEAHEAPPPAAAAAPATSAAPASAALSPPRFDADYLRNPAPVYPAISKRIGEAGKVLLRVFVDADGRPGTIEIRSSSGSSRLDQAALDAVRRWQFVAARQGDQAVGAWVIVPILFTLKD